MTTRQDIPQPYLVLIQGRLRHDVKDRDIFYVECSVNRVPVGEVKVVWGSREKSGRSRRSAIRKAAIEQYHKRGMQ